MNMNPEQLYGQAQQFLADKKHNEAYKILKKLDSALPNHPGVLYLIAVCQSLAGKKENATATYQRVLKLQPNFVEAMNNLGLDLKQLGKNRKALEYFNKALELEPSFFDARLNKASVLLAMHKDHEASEILLYLLGVAPNHPMVLANLGTAHLKNKDYQVALEYLEQAHKIRNDDLDIARGYMESLSESQQWENLIDLGNDLPINISSDLQIRNSLLRAYLQTCDWKKSAEVVDNCSINYTPINALCVMEDGKLLLECMTKWSKNNPRSSGTQKFICNNNRLKVGYISSDFKSHPVSYLINGVFGSHNPELFEIHGIAIDIPSPPEDCYRQKIRRDCYKFHEFGNLDDELLIERIRDINFDILIDLNGHTNDDRTAFLAERCAPIQIQYLGFPGTMGAPYIDYTIGDAIITPQTHFNLYTEKIISLPECFQANDQTRNIKPAVDKSEFNVPENVFVFACFNQQIKITPKIFDVWLKIMMARPNSILWLVYADDIQIKNLQNHASSRGVAPERLLFARRIDYEEHLGRYALVDLVLDTFPFNGGTTTSDALWGGAPVLTMIGNAYSSRMSASLLHSVGLDELVTKTLSEYEALAIELATNVERLHALRQRLNNNLKKTPLFDTRRFVKHLELGLTMAMKRYKKGLKPDHLIVPLID